MLRKYLAKQFRDDIGHVLEALFGTADGVAIYFIALKTKWEKQIVGKSCKAGNSHKHAYQD